MTTEPSMGQACDGHRNAAVSVLRDYAAHVEVTDRLPADELRPVLMGLFGEVGSILATAKKLRREQSAYVGYDAAIAEEFGDALWYFAALCRRLGAGVDGVFSDALLQDEQGASSETGPPAAGLAPQGNLSGTATKNEDALISLAIASSDLLDIRAPGHHASVLLRKFAECYWGACHAAGLSFATVAFENEKKTRGRFIEPDISDLPTFDRDFPIDEQLPNQFRIEITQRKSGRAYLRWNGVFIGDPLTDNIRDPDGYRFHDVFHLAHAAILHWSPTFRKLIKQKRKSDPKIDEAEDGGRAGVIEEGLTALIFSRAKQLNFFEGQSSVSFDLLKTIQQFVQGYEVEQCPLSLWERAILEGYGVFRLVRDNDGGVVIGSREARTITYEPIAREQ